MSASRPPSDAGIRSCPVCASAQTEGVARFDDVVVHCNLLWRSRDEAVRAPRADVDLVVCLDCGHLFNRLFDPTLMRYGEQYENALEFSETFRRYASRLADRLVERNGLYGKTIVELGCGAGEFLKLLCERGDNRGFGFDPGVPESHTRLDGGRGVTLIQGSWSGASPAGLVDFVCCRHVLEHLDSPLRFLAGVHDAADATGCIDTYFEVPNGLCMLRDLLGWDVIYEHFSYFTPSSLSYAFESASFTGASVEEQFGGQFLGVETSTRQRGSEPSARVRSPGDGAIERAPDERGHSAAPGFGPEESGAAGVAEVLAAARAFEGRWRSHTERLRTDLEEARRARRRTVVWGAGSKGVMFVNAMGEAGAIDYVVDVNPRKRDNFVAGGGQRIVEPRFLRDYRPDAVLVMNPNYTAEITAALADLRLCCDVIAV